MNVLEASVEAVAQYVDFVTSFGRSPNAAVTPVLSSRADGKSKVSHQLLLFTGFGVGFAYLAVVVGNAIGMASDRSPILGVLGRIEQQWMPLAVATAIFFLSLSWHALVRIVAGLLKKIMPLMAFSGTFAGSFNAGLALGAFYIPAFTILLVVVRLFATTVPVPTSQAIAFAVVGFIFWLAFLVHAVAAFAAAHKFPLERTAVLFLLANVPLALLLTQLQ